MTATRPSSQSSSRGFILLTVAIVVIGLGGVAYLASTRDGGIPEAIVEAEPTAEVQVSGQALTPLPPQLPVSDSSTDPEAGSVAPTLTGTDALGGEVTIAPDGRAKAVYFLAHWCPHCQAEVPLVQELIDEGRVPDGLDLYAVSTAVDQSRPNHPPQVWLHQEGFEPPTIRDDPASSALQAYGASGFPYVVYLDGENRVVARSAGELGKDGIAAMWELTVSN